MPVRGLSKTEKQTPGAVELVILTTDEPGRVSTRADLTALFGDLCMLLTQAQAWVLVGTSALDHTDGKWQTFTVSSKRK